MTLKSAVKCSTHFTNGVIFTKTNRASSFASSRKDSTTKLIGTGAAPQIRSPCWNLYPDYQQTNDVDVLQASHSSVSI